MSGNNNTVACTSNPWALTLNAIISTYSTIVDAGNMAREVRRTMRIGVLYKRKPYPYMLGILLFMCARAADLVCVVCLCVRGVCMYARHVYVVYARCAIVCVVCACRARRVYVCTTGVVFAVCVHVCMCVAFVYASVCVRE